VGAFPPPVDPQGDRLVVWGRDASSNTDAISSRLVSLLMFPRYAANPPSTAGPQRVVKRTTPCPESLQRLSLLITNGKAISGRHSLRLGALQPPGPRTGPPTSPLTLSGTKSIALIEIGQINSIADNSAVLHNGSSEIQRLTKAMCRCSAELAP